jgi:hypothetical protein
VALRWRPSLNQCSDVSALYREAAAPLAALQAGRRLAAWFSLSVARLMSSGATAALGAVVGSKLACAVPAAAATLQDDDEVRPITSLPPGYICFDHALYQIVLASAAAAAASVGSPPSAQQIAGDRLAVERLCSTLTPEIVQSAALLVREPDLLRDRDLCADLHAALTAVHGSALRPSTSVRPACGVGMCPDVRCRR